MKVVWMFSGQGSQFYGMGRELYEQEPVFREVMDRGEAIVRPLLRRSLLDTLYGARENRFEPFTEITLTHPAIFLVEVALAQLLLSRGAKPDELLGYSLGEYAAMTVAGVWGFDAAVRAVVKQSLLLRYGGVRGRMAAVLEAPEAFDDPLFAGCERAGVHFPKSFVIAAPGETIPERVVPALRQRGVGVMELPVTYPFHTHWMDRLKTPSRAVSSELEWQPPRWPILSASAGGPVAQPSPDHLWDATRLPIDFTRIVNWLETRGPWAAVDLGPSGGMATAVKYNLPPGSPTRFQAVITPYGHERRNLEAVLAGFHPGRKC